MSLAQISSRITPFGFSHPSAWKTFWPLLPDRTVSSDRDHLPWQPFSARFKGTFCRHLKSSATWNLHADNSDTLHRILPDDLCQFNGIIGAVKFRTSHQHHTIVLKIHRGTSHKRMLYSLPRSAGSLPHKKVHAPAVI